MFYFIYDIVQSYAEIIDINIFNFSFIISLFVFEFFLLNYVFGIYKLMSRKWNDTRAKQIFDEPKGHIYNMKRQDYVTYYPSGYNENEDEIYVEVNEFGPYYMYYYETYEDF